MTALFIHVGYPKTATTTFQKHVFPNHPEIDYLGKFIPGHRYRDERLYPSIDRLMTVDESRYEGVVGLRELIDACREQCSKRVMLISSESFVHVTAVNLGLVAQRVKAAFSPCKIIITIREQLDIIRSCGRTKSQKWSPLKDSRAFREPCHNEIPLVDIYQTLY